MPDSIRALRELGANSANFGGQFETFFKALKEAVGPQETVVGGVPKNSRHAHVMIQADYHMKNVSQGHIALPGITSVLDLALETAKQSMAKTGTTPQTGLSMSRFWFHVKDGTPTFFEDENIVWVAQCPVILLTEMQRASVDGRLHDVREDDPTMIAFATNMSEQFCTLTKEVPVYADLENLFRLRALVLAMHFRSAPSNGGLEFNRFLPTYSYQDEKPIRPSLPGLANYRKWMDGGFVMYPMVAGGVGMDMIVNENSFIKRRDRRFLKPNPLFQFRMTALMARPFKDSLYWPVSSSKTAFLDWQMSPFPDPQGARFHLGLSRGSKQRRLTPRVSLANSGDKSHAVQMLPRESQLRSKSGGSGFRFR